jgi:hypothetical protein
MALNQLPVSGWWTFPQINNWGSFPDPQGYYPKPDVNVLLPANYPLAAIMAGTVTGINTPGSNAVPSFGSVITIQMDQALNQIATHYAMLHLARIQPGLVPGSRVEVGDIIGYGGASQTQGSLPAAVGFALYPGDYYGFGPEWQQYINRPSKIPDARLDPTALLQAAATGTVNNIALFTSNNQQRSSGNSITLSGFKENPVTPLLQPGESVTGVLQSLDNIMTLVDPTPNDVDQLHIFNTDIPNPISWIDAFFHNIFVVDLPALIVRGLVIALGVYMCFGVIKQLISQSGAPQAIQTVAAFAEGV